MQAVWRAESQADNSTMVSKELVLSFQSVVNKWVRSVPRLRPLRRFLTSNRYLPASTLMMIPDVAPASMSCGGVGRLGDWRQRRVAQICRRHQNERRNDAERKKAIKSREDRAEIVRGPRGEFPDDCPREKTRKCGNRARAGRGLKPRAALRAHDIVRSSRSFRRWNFRLAVRTYTNGHASPPETIAYNSRNRGPKKQRYERPELCITNQCLSI